MPIYYREYRTRSLHWVVDLMFGFVELLIGLRIILKLFGAGLAPFVRWVYETSQPLISPFEGTFPAPRLEGAFVLEISAIFALIIYAIIGYVLHWIIEEISYRVEE